MKTEEKDNIDKANKLFSDFKRIASINSEEEFNSMINNFNNYSVSPQKNYIFDLNDKDDNYLFTKYDSKKKIGFFI